MTAQNLFNRLEREKFGRGDGENYRKGVEMIIGQFGDVRFREDDSSADVAAADLIYWTVNMDMDQKVLRPEAFGLGTAKVS